jgi:hypothetical protein
MRKASPHARPISALRLRWRPLVTDTGVTQTTFLVDRRDFAKTTIQSAPLTPEAGEALLAVENFALTANNLTYALMGDSAHYWDFFPADAGWGRIPVWGFGRVVSPGSSGLSPGERLYGYFPMSSYATMRVGKLDEGGCYDLSAHRAKLSPVYNYYARVSFDPGVDTKRAHEDMLCGRSSMRRSWCTTPFRMKPCPMPVRLS